MESPPCRNPANADAPRCSLFCISHFTCTLPFTHPTTPGTWVLILRVATVFRNDVHAIGGRDGAPNGRPQGPSAPRSEAQRRTLSLPRLYAVRQQSAAATALFGVLDVAAVCDRRQSPPRTSQSQNLNSAHSLDPRVARHSDDPQRGRGTKPRVARFREGYPWAPDLIALSISRAARRAKRASPHPLTAYLCEPPRPLRSALNPNAETQRPQRRQRKNKRNLHQFPIRFFNHFPPEFSSPPITCS